MQLPVPTSNAPKISAAPGTPITQASLYMHKTSALKGAALGAQGLVRYWCLCELQKRCPVLLMNGVGAIIPFSMKLELPLRGDSLLYPLGSECPICLTPSGSTLPWQGQNLRQTELCGSGARTTPHSPLSPSLTGTPPSFEIHWPHPPSHVP